MESGRRSRALVCAVFLRVYGCISLIAFASLLAQIDLLYGAAGLLPVRDFLASLPAGTGFARVPTIFWLGHSDAALRGVAVAGALFSLGLMANLAPRYCLIAIWLLYLSFASVGQDFLSFQWDNLLLESAFFSLFIAPGGLRPARRDPHPIGLFLMQWLLFRLNVESGAAKILGGDPTWRDLTAMVSYYETAPLPTWLGWYAHQMPEWIHRASAAATYAVELGAPWLMWGPRRFRLAAFAALTAFQLVVLLTANYGFFNYLSIALCLFILDDDHLLRLVPRRFRDRSAWDSERPADAPANATAAGGRRTRLGTTVGLATVAALSVPLSIVPFFRFLPIPASLNRAVQPAQRILYDYRLINAYHLFAQMTLVRREVVIEGSTDGTTWQPYEFRYKPGDPRRPPPFVAPHQPRVDFQLWFLLLAGPPRAPYFHTLLERLVSRPEIVGELFLVDPFPTQPPRDLRFQVYQYRFTDAAERRATGAWWTREWLGQSALLNAQTLGVEGSSPPATP